MAHGRRGRRSTAKPGDWILGRGWHQEKWTAVPTAERRRLPVPRRAQQGVAGQPGDADARERPRRLRQRQAMEAAGLTRTTRESAGRRDSEGLSRPADRPASRDGVGHRRARRSTPGRRRRRPEQRAADARRQIELAVAGGAREGHHRRSRTPGANFATIDVCKQAAAEGAARHPPVGDGARQQREPARASCRRTKRSAWPTTT